MSEYKPIDECKTVEELLADPARWTKYEMARDADGEVCPELSPDAACFCIEGASIRIYGIGERGCEYYQRPCEHAIRKVKESVGIFTNVSSWNDAPERTHAEVLAAVRKAGI